MKFKQIIFIACAFAFFSAQTVFCEEPVKKTKKEASVAAVTDVNDKIKPEVPVKPLSEGADKIEAEVLEKTKSGDDLIDKIESDIDFPKTGNELPEKKEAAAANLSMSLDDILSKIEEKYAGSGFTASFTQKSVIKAMDITDEAEGTLAVKHPGMMRWEYETPEKQIILTNGDILWIFRPEDNQIMTGRAPAYFGDGKGAGFLSDIKIIRDKFTVTLEKDEDDLYYKLKMIPKEKKLDITLVIMMISKKTFEVNKIATYNSYDDETLIEMNNFKFNENIDDALFSFEIPEGADVVQLEE